MNIQDFQSKQELTNQVNSIKSKREELSIANRNLEVSGLNYRRFQELFNKGVISKVDLEKVEKEFLSEQREFQLLNQQYNQLILDNKLENQSIAIIILPYLKERIQRAPPPRQKIFR